MKKTLIVLVALMSIAMLAFAACAPETPPEAAKLTSIELTTAPTKLTYEIGETIDTAGMKVIAKFSDGTTKDVTADCTTSIGTTSVTATTASYYVKYEYENVIKTAKVNVTVNKIEIEKIDMLTLDPVPNMPSPFAVAKASDADYVFISSFNSTTMLFDCVMELNGDMTEGAFVYTERNDKIGDEMNKYGILNGTYKVKDGKITFTVSKISSANTSHLANATVDVADVIKNGDEVAGLYFGSMFSAEDTVFGWGKSTAGSFVESLATKYDYAVTTLYMEIVKNHEIPTDIELYHADVTSIEIATPAEKLVYDAGETISTVGLTIKVNYEAGASRVLSSGFEVDKVDALTSSDTLVTVSYTSQNYDLSENVKTVTFAITVNTPLENKLTSITVEGAPSTYKIYDGSTKKVSDMVASETIVVRANYSVAESKVITTYVISEADTIVTTSLTKYTFSYTEGDVTVTKEQTLAVSYITPYEIAAESAADYVFLTYFTKGSNKLNGVLELNGTATEGNYKYTAQMGADKYNVNAGTYAIADGVITFTANAELSHYVLGTSGMVTFDNETANVVVKDGAIVGLNFGSLGQDSAAYTDGFWGYKFSKASSATSSIADKFELTADIGYMVLIKDGDVSAYADGKFYE